MRRGDHLSEKELLECAGGGADEETAARVRAHLEEGCAGCAADAAFWTRSLDALGRSGPAPPPLVLERAVALFQERAPRPSAWQRLVATLTFDSRVAPAAGYFARTHGGSC